MTNYRLSPAAEQDLIEIAVFGIEQFGIAQAERYRDKLQQRFQQLAEKPHHYPAVDYIRPGYRRSVCGVHAIFYRVQPDYVEIMRIIGHNDF